MPTFNDWVNVYEKKTKERHINPKNYITVFDESLGYCQFLKDKDTLNVYECCGDGRFWFQYAIDIVKKYCLKRIIVICTRNILPYLRFMGAKIINKSTNTEKHNSYDINGIVKGYPFKCFAIWWNGELKRIAYCIILEVQNV